MIVATPGKKLRIVLADDHEVIRQGLKGLIDAQRDMEVVGEAECGRDAVAIACNIKPHVIVMDVSMPQGSGVEATKEIRKQCPETRVLALTMHEDRTTLRQMLEAGAAGYTVKRAASQELITAIRAVASCGVYLQPELAGEVVGGYVRRGPSSPRKSADAELLSERECEVVRLLASGYSNKEVGAKLDISVKTVETYRARVAEKLGIKSRVDIVRYAVRQGWMNEL